MRIILIFLAAAAVASAQELRLVTFQADSGVHLRWVGNTDPNVTGWHVERSDNNGAFVRLTNEPLTRITTYSEMTKLVGRYKALYFLTLWGVDTERDLTQADVQRRLSGEGIEMFLALQAAEPTIAVLNGEQFFDSSPLTAGTVRYRIVAMKGASPGASVTSENISIGTLDLVPVPDSVNALGGIQQVTLSWSRIAVEAESGSVVGYRVWRTADSAQPFDEITLQTSVPFFMEGGDTSSYSYIDVGVENGQTWYYYVRQVHGTGVLGGRSDIVKVVVGADAPPAIPLGLEVHPLGHAVECTWHWDSRAPAPVDVELWRLPSVADTPVAVQAVPPGNTSMVDAFTPMGVGVRYVVASMSATDTVFSDTVSYLQPDVLQPAAPDSVWAVSDTGRITIHWTRSPDADVRGYRVYRIVAQTPGIRIQVNPSITVDSVLVDALAVETESTYGYVVEAEDQAGLTSPPSAMVMARVLDITPPFPPQFTRFDRTGDKVEMEWSSSRSPDVAAYVVERRIADSAWSIAFERLSTGPWQDSLTDAGDIAYRVSAVDSAGNRSAPSQERATRVRKVLEIPERASAMRDTFAIRVQWQAVPSAAGYRVVRIDPQTMVRVECANVESSDLQWADTFSSRDRKWFYEIAARDAQWRFGPPRRTTYDPDVR